MDTPEENIVPHNNLSLSERLKRIVQDHDRAKAVETHHLQSSTDTVRTVLFPFIHKHKLPLATGITMIHGAHIRFKEQSMLKPVQKRNLLALRETEELQTIGGILRSHEFPLEVSLAEGLITGASAEETPHLMNRLTNLYEELFPIDDINPAVNYATIYQYAAALQLSIALIHPFAEANGRTSEDAMYLLWLRRPDLIESLRFLSSSSSRNNFDVFKQNEILKRGARIMLEKIGTQLGIEQSTIDPIHDYRSLVNKVAKQKGWSFEEATKAYRTTLDKELLHLVLNASSLFNTKIDDPLAKIVKDMSNNIANANEYYLNQNDTTLKARDIFSNQM